MTKYYRLGGLTTEMYFSHSSRGWDVQNQGTGRYGFWLKALIMSLITRTRILLDQGSTLTTSFNPNTRENVL